MSYGFLLDIKYNNKRSKFSVIWITDYKISNLFIYKNIKKELFILNNFIVVYLYKFLKHYDFKNSYIDKDTHKKTSIINNFKLTQESVSLISFDDCEKQIKLVDKEYNINDQTNIICFTARSKFFHEEEKNLDNDRNYSVSKLKKTFQYFISNNYKFFRINSENTNTEPELKNYFIDPKIDKENFIHSYLISKCKFLISSNSGPVDIAIVLKKLYLQL